MFKYILIDFSLYIFEIFVLFHAVNLIKPKRGEQEKICIGSINLFCSFGTVHRTL